MRLVSLLLIFFIGTISCTRDIHSIYVPKQDTIDFNPTEVSLNIPDSFPQPLFMPTLTEEGIRLGQLLFYDPILSADETQSCASCHDQSLAFTDGEQFSEGIRGLKGTKNAMALFNLVYHNEFFWNGRALGLPHQALMPVTDPLEMDDTWSNVISKLNDHPTYPGLFRAAFGKATIDSSMVAEAIAQFEYTLISANSKFDQVRKNENLFTPDEVLGFQIFNREPRKNTFELAGGDCFHCHIQPLFTNLLFENNGLDANPEPGLMEVTDNPLDKGKFKVPTLRNIEKTGPYMHDGRFNTLEEVVEFYNSEIKISPTLATIMLETDSLGDTTGIAGGLKLLPNEKAALVAFLKTLTDDEFLNNPDFSDPHVK